MSKYTTSPVNEAEERSVREWKATNGSNPTVETKVVIRMGNSVAPTASSSATPTVSTDKVIRLISGTPPTAQESEAVGGTPVVIETAGDNGSVEQGATGHPTVSTDDVIGMVSGTTPTAQESQGIGGNPTARHLNLIVCTQGTANVARRSSKTTVARISLRLIRCAEGSANVALDRLDVAAQVKFVIEDTEGSANVAKSSSSIIAEERLAA